MNKYLFLILLIYTSNLFSDECVEYLERVSDIQSKFWKFHEEKGELSGIWKKRNEWKRKYRDKMMVDNAGVTQNPIPIFYLEEAGADYVKFSLYLEYMDDTIESLAKKNLSPEKLQAIEDSKSLIKSWFNKFNDFKYDINKYLDEALSLHEQLAKMKKLNLKRENFPKEVEFLIYKNGVTQKHIKKFINIEDYRVFTNGTKNRLKAITGGGTIYKPSFQEGFIFKRELEQAITLRKIQLYRNIVDEHLINTSPGSKKYSSYEKLLNFLDNLISDPNLLPSERVNAALLVKEMDAEKSYRFRSTYQQLKNISGSDYERFLSIEEQSRLGIREGGKFAKYFNKHGKLGAPVYMFLTIVGGGTGTVIGWVWTGATKRNKLKKQCIHVECKDLSGNVSCDDEIPVKELKKVYQKCLADKYYREYYSEEYIKAVKDPSYKPFSDKNSDNYKKMLAEQKELDQSFAQWMKELQARHDARENITDIFVEINEK